MASNAQMQSIIEGLATVSDRIRALDRAGYSRSDIARFLGKRYQHVRNVLVGDQQVARADPSNSRPEHHPTTEPEKIESGAVKVRLGADGAVQLPTSFRDALGLKDGDALFARLSDGEIHLLTPTAAMRRAQAIVRQFVPEGVSLVNELLDDRRREVEREGNGG
jgi:hypothetical protein